MLIAYKAFNENLTCTKGRGTYQYKVDVWHETDEANVARNGFHACTCPLDTLNYYSYYGARIFAVLCDGDINEDACDTRLSCTRMKLVKELTTEEFVIQSVMFIQKNPQYHAKGYVLDGKFQIVRGEKPSVLAKKGETIALMKEIKGEFISINVFTVDGKDYQPGVYTI